MPIVKGDAAVTHIEYSYLSAFGAATKSTNMPGPPKGEGETFNKFVSTIINASKSKAELDSYFDKKELAVKLEEAGVSGATRETETFEPDTISESKSYFRVLDEGGNPIWNKVITVIVAPGDTVQKEVYSDPPKKNDKNYYHNKYYSLYRIVWLP